MSARIEAQPAAGFGRPSGVRASPMDPVAPRRGIYIPPSKKSRWDDPRLRWGVIGIAGILVVSGFALALAMNFGGDGTAYIEVYVTDAPAGFEKILLEVARVEVGDQRYRLPVVAERFDILDQQGPEDALRLAAGEVPFAQHSNIAIAFSGARAHIGDQAFDLHIEKGLLEVDAGVDIAASRSGALLIDLDMDQSVCVGPAGFVFCPKVKDVYFQDLTAKDAAGNPPAPQREGFRSKPLGDVQQAARQDPQQETRRNPFACSAVCETGSSGGQETPSPSVGPNGTVSILGDGPVSGTQGQHCGLDPDRPPSQWHQDAFTAAQCPEEFLNRAWVYTDTFIVHFLPQDALDAIQAAQDGLGAQSPGQQVNDAREGAQDTVEDRVPLPTTSPPDPTQALETTVKGILSTATATPTPTAPLSTAGPVGPPIPSVAPPPTSGTTASMATGAAATECALNPASQAMLQDLVMDASDGLQVLGFLCTIEAMLVTSNQLPDFAGLLALDPVTHIEPVLPVVETFWAPTEPLGAGDGGGYMRAAKRDMGWYEVQNPDGTLRFSGAGVVAGVIDIGFDARQPDLGYKPPTGAVTDDPAFLANWKLAKVPCQVVLAPVQDVDWVTFGIEPAGIDPVRYEYNTCSVTAAPGIPNVAGNVPWSEDNRNHGTMVAGVVASRPPDSVAVDPDATGGIAPGGNLIGIGVGVTAVNVQKGVTDETIEAIWGAQLLQGEHAVTATIDGWNLAVGLDLAVRRLALGDDIDLFVASWGKPAAYYDPNGAAERLLARIAKPVEEGGYGKPIFFAAGNSGTSATNGAADDVNAFCRIPHETIFCVGAFETAPEGRQQGKVATLSSRGVLHRPETWHVDAVVQGVGVTTVISPTGYQQFTGTSASAPAAAGCAMLMLEANPALDGRAVTRILRQTAVRDFAVDMPYFPHADGSLPPLSGSAGHGAVYCKGAVDAALALR